MATSRKRGDVAGLFTLSPFAGARAAEEATTLPKAFVGQKSFENLRQIAAEQTDSKKSKTLATDRHPISALKRTGSKFLYGLHKHRCAYTAYVGAFPR